MIDKNNIIKLNTKEEFYIWLLNNSEIKKECYIQCNKKNQKNSLYYVDAVYVALCFGWIDSTLRTINGKVYQRFSKRNKNSNWSELNKARCLWLIKNNLMTKSGFKTLPNLNKKFKIDNEILKELQKNKKTWENFKKFPELYKRIRIGNIQRDKKIKNDYQKTLKHFIEETNKNKMYGNWNDNGKLTNIYNK